jgi:DNA-binding CsgD family transcriptional regulator
MRTWPDRGNNLVLRAYLEALFADIDGADDRVARWNAVLPDIDREALPIGYMHLARLYAAEALADAGRRDDAGALLQQIVDEAPGHGVSLLARWAREFAARAGIVIDRTDVRVRPGRGEGISSLTPREREVLALVADGLTNPEIGRRLFISPKTASVHVSAILAKTGTANRAEAAALFAASQ